VSSVRRVDPLRRVVGAVPLDADLLDLAWRLLAWSPADRISAADALRHPALQTPPPATSHTCFPDQPPLRPKPRCQPLGLDWAGHEDGERKQVSQAVAAASSSPSSLALALRDFFPFPW
jgi:serine/threonine protein kinase